ncbi:hypothetical protein C4573_06565 [Candidatus Woesearchaeota archaeon]|nr:MAG: hypothetical protein C4573_06565 [Candidatus Woesearchaeota archaeon]
MRRFLFVLLAAFLLLAVPVFAREAMEVDDRLKAEVKDLSVEQCVEKLQQRFPNADAERIENRCDEIKKAYEELRDEDAKRLRELAKDTWEGLSDEEKNKLKYLNRERLQALSEMNEEQMKALLAGYRLVKYEDGFKKRVIARERLEEWEDRFDQWEERLDELSDTIKEKRNEFLRFKQLEKECRENNTNSSDCQEIYEEAIAKAKEHLLNLADKEIALLEKLKTRVEQNENIDDEKAQEILEEIDERIAALTQAKEAVQDATTKDELKEAAEAILENWKDIKELLKVHTYQLYHSRVGEILQRATMLERKLDNLLAYMAENNLSTEAIAPLVDAFGEKIESARAKFEEADEKLKDAYALKQESQPDVDAIKNLSNEAKVLLEQAHEELNDAHEIFKDISELVKDQRDLLKESDDDYYVLEDDDSDDLDDDSDNDDSNDDERDDSGNDSDSDLDDADDDSDEEDSDDDDSDESNNDNSTDDNSTRGNN